MNLICLDRSSSNNYQAVPTKDTLSTPELITPEEQLKRLVRPEVIKQLRNSHPTDLEWLSKTIFIEQITDSLVQSILNRKNPENQQVPSLFNKAVERLVKLPPIFTDPILTDWYKALELIDARPDAMPPLPEDILQTLESPCPVSIYSRWSLLGLMRRAYQAIARCFGKDLKVKDTHVLYLVPSGSLKELEQRFSAYGQTVYQNENPLRFRVPLSNHPCNAVPFPECEWVLITKNVVPGSRYQTCATHVQMVAALSEQSSTNYEQPSLREVSSVAFLHKALTNVSLWQKGNAQNGNVDTAISVNDLNQGGDQVGFGRGDFSGWDVGLVLANQTDRQFGVAGRRQL